MQFGFEACHELNHFMVSISIPFSIQNDTSNMVEPFIYALYSYLYPRHQIYQLKKKSDFIKTMSAIPNLDRKKITNIDQFNLVISSLVAGTTKLHCSTKCTIPHESHTSSWYHYIEYNQMMIMCDVEYFVNKKTNIFFKIQTYHCRSLSVIFLSIFFFSFLHRTLILRVFRFPFSSHFFFLACSR